VVDVDRALYYVLLTGMFLSTGLFVAGLVAFAVPSLSGYSGGILMAATVALIATPVTRAFVGTISFWLNRDLRLAMVAGLVSLVLILSVLLGFLFH
jgi:uncharacterized membrane protein